MAFGVLSSLISLCIGLKIDKTVIMNIAFIIIAFIISIYVARLIIPCILLISFCNKLFDILNECKVCKRAIPRSRGVTFFPTILFSCCLVLTLRTLMRYGIADLPASYILPEFLALVCGLVLLYLTGIADDLVGVRYRQKLIIQLICVCLFIPCFRALDK